MAIEKDDRKVLGLLGRILLVYLLLFFGLIGMITYLADRLAQR